MPAVSPHSIAVTVGSDTAYYDVEVKPENYAAPVGALVGVAPYVADFPFVPYRKEELIEGRVAVTLKLNLLRQGVKKVLFLLCSISKSQLATDSVKVSGSYKATSLWGKSMTYLGQSNWLITSAETTINQRVKD